MEVGDGKLGGGENSGANVYMYMMGGEMNIVGGEGLFLCRKGLTTEMFKAGGSELRRCLLTRFNFILHALILTTDI